MRAWEPRARRDSHTDGSSAWQVVTRELCREGQQCPLGLSSKVLTLGAPLEVASWPSTSLWVQICRVQVTPEEILVGTRHESAI